MNELNKLLCLNRPKENQTVVRVETSCWHDASGAYKKKSLKVLKRKSFGYNHILHECNMLGTYDCLRSITNLDDVPDGIYEVVVCNEHKDWETGCVDDWDLKLVPFDSLPCTKQLRMRSNGE